MSTITALEKISFDQLTSWNVKPPLDLDQLLGKMIRHSDASSPYDFSGGFRGLRGGGESKSFGMPTLGGSRGGFDFDYPTTPAPKKVETTKPEVVPILEAILSEAYGRPVSVTGIKDLPSTHKQVKEIYIHVDDKLSRIWIFKADPKKTARELAAYNLIYQKGIPTGRPIGYSPSNSLDDYPFDVAILGGIVEHAGDPYKQMLKNLGFKPNLINQTAEVIVRMIADYQLKLTLAQPELRELGIDLSRASPRKEIKDQFLAAIGKDETQGEGLIRACEELYSVQEGTLLVSHGDLHLGNIVTIKEGEASLTSKFGIIDWESLCLDHQYGDVQCFLAHHQREAKKACILGYSFTNDPLTAMYSETLAQLDLGHQLTSSSNSNRDAVVQSTLWHIYEIFDPTRTNRKDAQEKAVYHVEATIESLRALIKIGLEPQAQAIWKELKPLLAGSPILQD
ncbi:MAG: hypothetical protein WCV90_01075 [Candidatus Woesearchaeota archaeon]